MLASTRHCRYPTNGGWKILYAAILMSTPLTPFLRILSEVMRLESRLSKMNFSPTCLARLSRWKARLAGRPPKCCSPRRCILRRLVGARGTFRQFAEKARWHRWPSPEGVGAVGYRRAEKTIFASAACAPRGPRMVQMTDLSFPVRLRRRNPGNARVRKNWGCKLAVEKRSVRRLRLKL